MKMKFIDAVKLRNNKVIYIFLDNEGFFRIVESEDYDCEENEGLLVITAERAYLKNAVIIPRSEPLRPLILEDTTEICHLSNSLKIFDFMKSLDSCEVDFVMHRIRDEVLSYNSNVCNN